MKIYNKRKFYFSIFWLLIAVVIILMSLIQHKLDFNGIFSAVCCGILGINGLGRSLSKKKTQEDKVEELDERNKLIELKSKRKAFQLMQCILLVVGIIFAMIGGIYKSVTLGSVGVTSALMWTLTLLLDWITYAYYEMKN